MTNSSEKYLFLGVKQLPKSVYDTFTDAQKKQFVCFVKETDDTYGIYFNNKRFANETYTEGEINTLLLEKQDVLTAGSGITIVDNVISAIGGEVNDTWRTIKVNGTDFLGSGTNTGALNVTGGTNITVSTGSDGKLIISATGIIVDTSASNNSTYSSIKIEQLIRQIGDFSVLIVNSLPTTGDTHTIYFVPASESGASNVYVEYMYINNDWEMIGSTQIDLSNYYTKTEVDSKLNGKQNTLTAGTGIEITGDTINCTVTDTNTWRPIQVNSDSFLGGGTNTGNLIITGGTNTTAVTVDGKLAINAKDTTYSQGTGIEITNNNQINCTVTDTDTHRPIQVNSQSFLGDNVTTLNLSAGTNVTLTTGTGNGNVIISAANTTYSEGRNITITDNNNKINAEGYTYNSGITSFAITGNTASGGNSFAEGSGTTASGDYSHAEGYQTSATTGYTHTEGWKTLASGIASHAEGHDTKATGYYSHAGGYWTTANLPYMTAIGISNKSGVTDEVFVVGNGAPVSGQEKNALTVHRNGTDTVTAKVNGVEDVYLGVPIGTVVMWAGSTAPSGWLLCTGATISGMVSNPYDSNYSECYVRFKDNNTLYIHTIWIEKFYKDLLDKIGPETILPYGGKVSSYPVWGTTSKDIIGVANFSGTGVTYFTNSLSLDSLKFIDYRKMFPLGAQDGSTIGKNGHDDNSSGYSTDLGSTGGEGKNTLSEREMPSHSHKIDRAYGGSSSGYGLDDAGDISSQASTTYTTGGSQPHNNIPPFFAINFIIKYQ